MGPTTVAVAPTDRSPTSPNAWSGIGLRIRSSDHTVTATIAVGANPIGMAISPTEPSPTSPVRGDNTCDAGADQRRPGDRHHPGGRQSHRSRHRTGWGPSPTSPTRGGSAADCTSDNALAATTAALADRKRSLSAPDGSSTTSPTTAPTPSAGCAPPTTPSRLRCSGRSEANRNCLHFDGSSAFVTIGAESASVVRVRTSDNMVTATIGVGACRGGRRDLTRRRACVRRQ